MKKKVLIFIVAYNAQRHIEKVLQRIPDEVWCSRRYSTEVIIIDDCSADDTTKVGITYKLTQKIENLKIMQNPVNQGYGGNQKIGFYYAVKHGFDHVVLLHGDGQYAPELLPDMLEPLLSGKADVVFGSRMMKPFQALRGGMPVYKFIGNRILTTIQNFLLKSSLSEFHSGYRAYSVKALAAVPFSYNSNDFDFDTDIIIQMLDHGFRIAEIPIPTFYGDEICNVNGFKYAFNILKNTILFRLQRYCIYYCPKFDRKHDTNEYSAKTGFSSSHQFAVKNTRAGSSVLDIGCREGHVSKALLEKGCRVHGLDWNKSDRSFPKYTGFTVADLDEVARGKQELGPETGKPDVILLLDILEHLDSPEKMLNTLRKRFSGDIPDFIIIVPNVAFFVQRLSLLTGSFNYGKNGILDFTHKRLFTMSSLLRLLEHCGYTMIRKKGIPVPFPLIFGNGIIGRSLLALNEFLIGLFPGLFSFEIGLVARAAPDCEVLLERGRIRGQQILETLKNEKSG